MSFRVWCTPLSLQLCTSSTNSWRQNCVLCFMREWQDPKGRIFTAACIGLKADMKYHTKVGCLARSYEHKGRVRDLGCCHHCQGGFPNIPWEDVTETPIWEPTIYSERPWPLNQEPPLQRIPFDLVEPEAFYRTDPFHTGKVGALRDYVGSSLFWLIEHHYYGW